MKRLLQSLFLLLLTSYVCSAQVSQVQYDVYLTTLSHRDTYADKWIEDSNQEVTDMQLRLKGDWLSINAKAPVSVRLIGQSKEEINEGYNTLSWRGVYEGRECTVFIAVYHDGRKAFNLFFNRNSIQYCFTYWFID